MAAAKARLTEDYCLDQNEYDDDLRLEIEALTTMGQVREFIADLVEADRRLRLQESATAQDRREFLTVYPHRTDYLRKPAPMEMNQQAREWLREHVGAFGEGWMICRVDGRLFIGFKDQNHAFEFRMLWH